MGGDRKKKFLCAAPRPSSWEEKADALLRSLGGDPKKRETVLRQTLSVLRERYDQDAKRSGPGRRSNAEHAIGFYEYVLDLNDEDGDDDSDEESDDGGSTSGHDGDEDDEKRDVSKRRKKKKSARRRKKKLGRKRGSSGERKRGRPKKTSSQETETSDASLSEEESADSSDNSSGESAGESSEEEVGNHQEEKTVESMDSVEFLNEHNDDCDVCNIGGELLCCSTCNLVFHLDCVRPVLAELPPGDWSCAHCIVSGVRGHKRKSRIYKAAAAGVRHMDRLRSRLQKQRMEQGEELDSSAEGGDGGGNEVEEKSSNIADSNDDTDGKAAPETPGASQNNDDPVSARSDANDNKESERSPTIENDEEAKAKEVETDDGAIAEEQDQSGIADSRDSINLKEEDETAKDEKAKTDKDGVESAKDTNSCDGDETEGEEGDKKPQQRKRPPAKRSLALYKIADSLSPAMKIESRDNDARVRRQRRQPTLFNPQNCADSEWQSDERLEWLTNSTRASSSEDEKSGGEDLNRPLAKAGKNQSDKTSAKPQSKVDTSDAPGDGKDMSPAKVNQAGVAATSGFVWCSFCKDDPSIPICCFCACRICFGKHDKPNLLLCDRCDGEYHIFCLDPPLKQVPTTKKWYCPKCKPLIAEELAAAKALSNAGTTKASVKKTPRVSPKIGPGKKGNRSKSPSSASSKSSKSGSGRPRGRPPKSRSPGATSPETPTVPRKRGRPPKTSALTVSSSPPGSISAESGASGPRKRGRPPKSENLSPLQASAKKQRTPQKSPSPTAKCSTEKRKAGSGSLSPTGDSKRARTGKSNESADRVGEGVISQVSTSAETVGGKEVVIEVKHSRSGRMLKRSSFHDEIEEGEQHLRVTQTEQSRKQKKVQKQIEKPQRSKSDAQQKSKPEAIPVPEIAISEEDDEDEKMDAESLESVGPARPLRPIVLASTQSRPPTILPSVPAESVALPDEDSTASQATEEAKRSVASPILPTETTPAVEKESDIAVEADSTVRDDATVKSEANAATTTKVELGSDGKEAETPAKVAVAAVPPAATPAAPTPAVGTSSGPSKEATSSAKVPRRKPGARECMQISRRFGVRVIPDKYMDTLLDYCTRGKVEHLIRMRERLDEHSRYLESQLAGLEALVAEKGEIDVVVPILPERAPDNNTKPPPAAPAKGNP